MGSSSQSVSHRASHAVSNLGPFSRLLSHPASRLTANQPSANQLPSQPASSTSHPASQQPSSQLVIQLASEAQPSQTGSQALPNQTISQSQPAAKVPRRDPKTNPKNIPKPCPETCDFLRNVLDRFRLFVQSYVGRKIHYYVKITWAEKMNIAWVATFRWEEILEILVEISK